MILYELNCFETKSVTIFNDIIGHDFIRNALCAAVIDFVCNPAVDKNKTQGETLKELFISVF